MIIENDSIKFLEQNVFKDNWIVRRFNPDFGIDLELEFFNSNIMNCDSLGEHLLVQVKGTLNPNYSRYKNKDKYIDVIKYNLEVSELNLVEKMGSALPLILIVVDLLNQKAYYICLNDYVKTF